MIKILCVGKLKEKYWKDACEEYLKRLTKYVQVELVEVMDEKIDDEKIKLNLAQAQKIRIKKNSITYEIVLKILKNQKVVEPKFTGKVDKKIIKAYKNRFNSDKEFNDLLMKLLEDYFTSDSE